MKIYEIFINFGRQQPAPKTEKNTKKSQKSYDKISWKTPKMTLVEMTFFTPKKKTKKWRFFWCFFINFYNFKPLLLRYLPLYEVDFLSKNDRFLKMTKFPGIT